jgi:hypothetical protein
MFLESFSRNMNGWIIAKQQKNVVLNTDKKDTPVLACMHHFFRDFSGGQIVTQCGLIPNLSCGMVGICLRPTKNTRNAWRFLSVVHFPYVLSSGRCFLIFFVPLRCQRGSGLVSIRMSLSNRDGTGYLADGNLLFWIFFVWTFYVFNRIKEIVSSESKWQSVHGRILLCVMDGW